jgi:tetrapyrrole methylase family protein/MazG family protein
MSLPTVRIVGLGPGPSDLLTTRTRNLLASATVARLRTREHPAAEEFSTIESYDTLYETAKSFEVLYAAIVDDLCELARTSPTKEVVYAVPGSPVVAEHTTELLLAREDVTVVLEPAVSVIDIACTALGQDPMTVGVRICDALGTVEPFRGPGPLLILQTYSPEIMVIIADRLPAGTEVTILHHLGLPDELIVTVASYMLSKFVQADHLTSLWVTGLRTAGETMDDLVSFARRLRVECPWDQEQDHASLIKYLLEESYEAIEALENFVRESPDGSDDPELVAHVEEELGDLLFQVVFHAELGDEESRFNLATIADSVRDKLTGRHPHVFGDTKLDSPEEVVAQWEEIKKEEKGRTTALEGVVWQLPALTLASKVLSRARRTSLAVATAEEARGIATAKINLEVTTESLGTALWAIVVLAAEYEIDLEGALREQIYSLRTAIEQKNL